MFGGPQILIYCKYCEKQLLRQSPTFDPTHRIYCGNCSTSYKVVEVAKDTQEIRKHFKTSKNWEDHEVFIKEMSGYWFIRLDYQGVRMGTDVEFKMTRVTEGKSKEDLMCHNWIEKINGEYYLCDPHYSTEEWFAAKESE